MLTIALISCGAIIAFATLTALTCYYIGAHSERENLAEEYNHRLSGSK